MSRSIKRWKFWPGSSTNYSTLYPPAVKSEEDARWLLGFGARYFDRKARVYKDLPEAEQIAKMKRRLARYYFKHSRGRWSPPSSYCKMRNRTWTMLAKRAMDRGLRYDEDREVVLPRAPKDASWYYF